MEKILEGFQDKPFIQLLGISPSRFSQKKYEKTVNGYKQSFTTEEKNKIKSMLIFIVESTVLDLQKL